MAKNGSIQNVSYNIICGKHLIAHQGGESGEGGGGHNKLKHHKTKCVLRKAERFESRQH